MQLSSPVVLSKEDPIVVLIQIQVVEPVTDKDKQSWAMTDFNQKYTAAIVKRAQCALS